MKINKVGKPVAQWSTNYHHQQNLPVCAFENSFTLTQLHPFLYYISHGCSPPKESRVFEAKTMTYIYKNVLCIAFNKNISQILSDSSSKDEAYERINKFSISEILK